MVGEETSGTRGDAIDAGTAADRRATDGRLPAPGSRHLAEEPIAWGPVLIVAACLLGVLLTLAGRYGPHRDELYFVAAGHHLAWGYPDQPPLTPLLARLADLVAPGSLLALHTIPALAATGTVVLSALLAAELGGRTPAQVLTAVAVGSGAIVVALGHILSTASIDLVIGTAITYAALRVLRRETPRGWLVVGLLVGIGAENKDTTLFLVAALALGLLASPAARHHLRSPWLWSGVGLAALLALPDVVWQATHGWPQSVLAGEIRDASLTVGGRAGYVGLLLVLLGPLVTVLWVRGLVRLWRVPDLATARPFAWAFVVLFVVFFATGGKAYYLTGALPVLVAAGACGRAARRTAREMVAATAMVGLVGVLVWPASLPILSPRSFDTSFYASMNADQSETIGWPRLVRAVDAAAEVSRAGVIVTANYGEAGALEWYGSPVPVYSGHNGFGEWGPPSTSASPIVLVGFDGAPDWAVGCRTVGRVDEGAGIDNQEQGASIDVCTGPRGSWHDVWAQVRHLDA